MKTNESNIGEQADLVLENEDNETSGVVTWVIFGIVITVAIFAVPALVNLFM